MKSYQEIYSPRKGRAWTTSLNANVHFPIAVSQHLGQKASRHPDALLQHKVALQKVVAAFKEMGMPLPFPVNMPDQVLARRLGVHEKYQQLTQYLIRQLKLEGLTENAAAIGSSEQLGRDSLTPFMELVRTCGEALPQILRDEQDPMNILFPDDGGGADDLYAQLPEVTARDHVLENILQGLRSSGSDKEIIEVLELSDGTSTRTTACLFGACAGSNMNYQVAKPSNSCLRRLSGGVASLPLKAIAPRSLNIEFNPMEQGWAPHSFDVVIAINSLHSAKNTSTALAHLRLLLRHQGVLILVERTTPSLALDITFGLLHNWWRFDNREKSRDHVLLSRETWSDLLEQAGFQIQTCFGNEELVIVSQGPDCGQQLGSAVSYSHYPWVIISSDSKVQGQLELLLTAERQLQDAQVVRKAADVDPACTYAGIICVCSGGHFTPFTSLAGRVTPDTDIRTKILLVTICEPDSSIYESMTTEVATMLVTLLGPQQRGLRGNIFTHVEVEGMSSDSAGLEVEIFKELWRGPERTHVLLKGGTVYESSYIEIEREVPAPADLVPFRDVIIVHDGSEGAAQRDMLGQVAQVVEINDDLDTAVDACCQICTAHTQSAALGLVVIIAELENPWAGTAVVWLCKSLTQARRRRGMLSYCIIMTGDTAIGENFQLPLSIGVGTPAVTLLESEDAISEREEDRRTNLSTDIEGGWKRSSAGDVPADGRPLTRKRSSGSLASTLLSGRSHKDQLGLIHTAVLDSLSHVCGLESCEIDMGQGWQDIGLDSLMILQLANRLETTFQIELAVTAIFDQPTPQQLVSWLQELMDGHASKTRRQSSFVQFEEDIAIIGAAARVGSACNLDEFWKLLLEGNECVTEIPAERFDWRVHMDPSQNHFGSFLTDVAGFDCDFFQISPNEAAVMDPQQRLLLQLTWEALENACVPPDSLAGSKTGVFIGSCSQDYRDIVHIPKGSSGAYCVTSNLQSVAAGRISYFFGLQGPSLCVDTACSSSLVALHLACSSILKEESRAAIVGGVNLILSPNMFVSYNNARMLSPGRQCRPFDDGADGMTRGEACGVVVLKKLADAWADGDNVLAVIRGTGLNQDGTSAGLTAPNGTAQAQLIRRTLNQTNVRATDIGYIEAHGTGTALGDPIEVNALETIFGESGIEPGRRRLSLYLGSVKANVGHTEGAAGLVGLLKVCLALKHGRIPPQINIRNLNKHIRSTNWFKIPKAKGGTRWERSKIGCVSSFGVSGTNAFAILEETPDYSRLSSPIQLSRPQLLTISAKNPVALERLLSAYTDRVNQSPPLSSEEFARVAFTSNVGRTHFRYRAAVLSQDSANFLEQVSEATYLRSTAPPRLQLCFLFTGQGSHYRGMGRELYSSAPYFRETFDMCARMVEEIVDGNSGSSITDVFEDDTVLVDTLFDDMVLLQATLFALEYSLAMYWINLGLVPTIVCGHSLGEYVAAAVSGLLSVDDAVALVVWRATAIRDVLAPGEWGMMAMNPQSWTGLQAKGQTEGLFVSALNSPKQLVISGRLSILKSLEVQSSEGILLQVPYGYHSPQMTSIVPAFRNHISKLTFGNPKLQFASSVTGGRVPAPGVSHEHWVDHLLRPVQFRPALEYIFHDVGCTTFLEIGPKPVLSTFGAHTLAEADFFCALRPTEPSGITITRNLAELYVLGFDIHFKELYTERIMKAEVPGYPFDNKYCWSTQLEKREGRDEVAKAGSPSNATNQVPVLVPPLPPTVTSAPFPAPQLNSSGSVQQRLQVILARMTGFQVVTPKLRLQALGLDVVMLQQLQVELSSEFVHCVPLTYLLTNPSVRDLSRRIAEPPPQPWNGKHTAAAFHSNPATPAMGISNKKISNIAVENASTNTDSDYPIGILGMSCKVGSANNYKEFWSLLMEGRTTITRAPSSRSEFCTHFTDKAQPLPFGSYITDVQQFDAAFFSVSKQEAALMDPQQRQLLQLTWHALESAGIAPDSLRGTNCGVFVGLSSQPDYDRVVKKWLCCAGKENIYSSYKAAGRIGHALGVKGACITFDTACSSSLVALHYAVCALRSRQVDLAIVGAASLALVPEDFDAYQQAGLLSIDGVSRPFDAQASGFVRGEGMGVVILKSCGLSDFPLAVVKGSAVASVGFASEDDQAALLRAALMDARLEPDEVDYVELHATGHRDAVEVNGLERVYGGATVRASRPLILGSVKSNVGHCEAAAGLVSLIKVVLSMRAGTLPQQLNLQEIHPGIRNPDFCKTVVAGGIKWPQKELRRQRVAGITALGSPGASAHVILEAFPEDLCCVDSDSKARTNSSNLVPGPYLFLISAKSENGMRALLRAYGALAPLDTCDLPHMAFSMTVTRTHFIEFRTAIVAATHAKFLETLSLRSARMQGTRILKNVGSSLGFHFGGSAELPLDVIQQIPVLAFHYKHLLTIGIQFNLQLSLQDSGSNEILNQFISQFIMGFALVDLGLCPDYVSGVGAGELVGAVMADLLSIPDALKLVVIRNNRQRKQVSFARSVSAEWVDDGICTSVKDEDLTEPKGIKFRRSRGTEGQNGPVPRSYWAASCKETGQAESCFALSYGETVHQIRDWASFVTALGQLWESREGVLLGPLYNEKVHQKRALPLYQFEHNMYWYSDQN